MADYVLFADNKPVAPVAADQVPDLEPLFGLRGIVLVPSLCAEFASFGAARPLLPSFPAMTARQLEMF